MTRPPHLHPALPGGEGRRGDIPSVPPTKSPGYGASLQGPTYRSTCFSTPVIGHCFFCPIIIFPFLSAEKVTLNSGHCSAPAKFSWHSKPFLVPSLFRHATCSPLLLCAWKLEVRPANLTLFYLSDQQFCLIPSPDALVQSCRDPPACSNPCLTFCCCLLPWERSRCTN